MMFGENAKLKHFRQALVMRLLFAFPPCRKNLHKTLQIVRFPQPIPVLHRMNIISTKKAISFLPSNTIFGEVIAAKVSAAIVLTGKRKQLRLGSFPSFQGVPPPEIPRHTVTETGGVRLFAASPRAET